MSNVKVSIVIPVYNVAEEYLRPSLNSVLDQEYSDLEIILVDDGSKSDTASLCDAFAAADPRIKVIHQKNTGVSKARNNGTMQCTGDYVMYVDADDLLSPKAVSIAVEVAEKHNSEIVLGATRRISSYDAFHPGERSGGDMILDEEKKKDYIRLVCFNATPQILGEFCQDGYYNRAPYSKLIKAEIAKKHLFPEGYPIGEDAIWYMRLLNDCQTVCLCNAVWYGYYIRSGSAIRKYYGNREQLAEAFLTTINEENKDFSDRYPYAHGRNTVVEFYCILRFDYLSDKCTLSTAEKKRKVREMIRREPWSVMFKKEVRAFIPARFRLLLLSVKTGTWIAFLKLSEKRGQKD